VARNSPSEPRRGSGRPGSPRARLFLALEPRDADRVELARWRDRLVAGRDDLRPPAAETLHLTLVFLGYRPEKEIPAIARAAFGVLRGHSPALLRPSAVVPLPRRGPRLFALELDDDGGRAAAIQGAASDALAARRFYRPEKRPWWPHMTLARVKRGRRAPPLEPGSVPGAIEAPLVTLYRSTLRPQGALYEPLERTELEYG
jgi:RNA 2',3'-cyclic 3'-phosphodiesterase